MNPRPWSPDGPTIPRAKPALPDHGRSREVRQRRVRASADGRRRRSPAALGNMPEVSLLASIPSPAENGFHIGPLFFRAYGICYVFAVLGAVVVTTRRWEKLGGDGALVQECALWGFPAGLIGGRMRRWWPSQTRKAASPRFQMIS